MPTYSIAKIAAEEVVRTMCRFLGIPTTIARLNVPYGVGPDGSARGWPAFHLAMLQAGMAIPVHPDRPNLFNPIDLQDIAATVPALLGAASTPATIVNWGGAEQVSLEEWCRFLADRCGYELAFEETEGTIGGVTVDLEHMHSITGPTSVSWRDGFGALADAWMAAAPA
jgi:nucleoside-diphosphate-sugar epimerase